MNIAAIIPAAGAGNRMGSMTEKQFLELGGMPVVAHTLSRFQIVKNIHSIYLVVPPDKIEYCRSEIVEKYGFTKVVEIVAGGKERQDSVYNGLLRLNSDIDIVLVHDGVRPFVTEEIIRQSLKEVNECGAVVVATPEKDTVKEVSEDLIIKRTLNRRHLWRIQTPQVFVNDVLLRAFREAMEDGYYGTDEASLVERAGYHVRVIMGSEFNIKITTPEELILGNAILASINKKN